MQPNLANVIIIVFFKVCTELPKSRKKARHLTYSSIPLSKVTALTHLFYLPKRHFLLVFLFVGIQTDNLTLN